MKDRSDDPSYHEQTILPRNYTLLQIIKTYSQTNASNEFSSIAKKNISAIGQNYFIGET